MTKKRRKSNKSRCLFAQEKKTQLIKPIENTLSVDEPIIKKTKNGQVVDVKKESVEENHLKVETKSNLSHSTKEPVIEQIIEKSKMFKGFKEEKSKIIDDIAEEKTLKSKSIAKTKQEYDKFILFMLKLMLFNFHVFFISV